MREPWPKGSRRIYYLGVGLWIVFLQGFALVADLFAARYWMAWHGLALVSGLVIGHIMTMRILAIAIQEWKNRV